MSKPVWKLDSEAANCKLCNERFALFVRRHHCRACGEVVCNACIKGSMPVSGYTSPEKACVPCFEAFKLNEEYPANDVKKLCDAFKASDTDEGDELNAMKLFIKTASTLVPPPFSAAVAACLKAIELAENAICNKRECKRLAQRVARVNLILLDLTAAKGVTPAFRQCAADLHEVFKKAVDLLKRFQGSTNPSQVERIKAQLLKFTQVSDEFSRIYVELGHSIQDATLSASVQDLPVPTLDEIQQGIRDEIQGSGLQQKLTQLLEMAHDDQATLKQLSQAPHQVQAAVSAAIERIVVPLVNQHAETFAQATEAAQQREIEAERQWAELRRQQQETELRLQEQEAKLRRQEQEAELRLQEQEAELRRQRQQAELWLQRQEAELRQRQEAERRRLQQEAELRQRQEAERRRLQQEAELRQRQEAERRRLQQDSELRQGQDAEWRRLQQDAELRQGQEAVRRRLLQHEAELRRQQQEAAIARELAEDEWLASLSSTTPANDWNAFQQANKGRGWSREKMRMMYYRWREGR